MKEELKRKIAGDTLSYTASVYIAQLLGMIGGIAVRRFLEPAEMGSWVLLQTFLTYGLLAECGILTSMYCLMPKQEASGDQSEQQKTRDASFTFAVTAALFVAAGFVGLAAVGWPDPSLATRAGLLALACGVITTIIYNYFVSYLWGTNGFGLLSRAVLLNALLQLGTAFILVRYWGLWGLLVAMPLVPALTLMYVAVQAGVLPRWCFDLKRSGALILYGAPVFLTGLLYTFFLSLDRLLIARWLGTEALGQYSLALVAFSFSSIAPKMFSIVLFPRIQGEVSVSGLSSAVSMVAKPDRAIAFLSPVLLAGAYLILPVLVYYLLPKYAAGIRPARMLLVGSFFLALVYNAQSYLVALGKRAHPMIFMGLAALSAMLAAVLLLSAGMGLEGVAAAMSLSFFVYFAGVSAYALGHVMQPLEIAGHIGEIGLVFIYFAAAVLGLGRAEFFNGTVSNFLARYVLFLVVFSPVLCWAEKRTGVLRLGADIIRQKLARGAA